ncbi:MAG TPA: carboxypeptidase regulatory-like domain-containing protein [Terracidiphilus sp.]|nr:carboxypeptidase regulatory-like domain-containing protein [Terracidiphilus sp.]
MNANQTISKRSEPRRWGFLLLVALLLALPQICRAQLDQGAITGTVTDARGAAVPKASVRLTDQGTGLERTTQTDSNGVYTFEPIKVGTYSITVSAPGFATTTTSGLQLHVDARLQANVQLKVGKVTETVQVTANSTPLLQTEEATTGQVMTTSEINDIPLNQRNYVFVAQLAAGVNPSNGSRGAGNGDFNANGTRETENNFILDGVDNNSNAIDFLNGASYVVKPPPDALQEFNIQTSDSSAEFGHSAGAVVNASIKSGTNQFHGDAWEYIRNNDLGEASPTEWSEGVTTPTTVLPYHQNQFGGTFGGPIMKNKLFFFGDYEGNRILLSSPQLAGVPTQEMISSLNGSVTPTGAQAGSLDLSQLLTPANTGQSVPWYVYEPNSGGGLQNPNNSNGSSSAPLGTAVLGSQCGNPVNVMCPSEIDSVAKKLLLAAYTKGNSGTTTLANTGSAGQAYNNYSWTQSTTDNTNQMDARVDYNISMKDQIFGRVSWNSENRSVTSVLGPIFDGGGTFDDGTFINHGKNAEFSWNHVFSPTLINQARFAYNWGFYAWFSQSYNNGTLDSQYGLGGLAAFSAALGNGGLPQIYVNEFPEIGPPLFQPSPEHQDSYQIIDDVTKIHGNQSMKFGIDIQNLRYSVYQPTFGKGAYNYYGGLTSIPGSPYPTGYGIADFLANQMDLGFESNPSQSQLGHWYRAAYFQDDWKVTRKLVLNLGLRYDYFSAPIEVNDHQAEFYPTSPINVAAAGTGAYVLPQSQKGVTISPLYTSELSADNISITYSGNRSLLNVQRANFAPRFGASYQVANRMVVRTGFGLYYEGAENLGNYVNLAENYPYDVEQNWPQPNCLPYSNYTSCQSDGLMLETGPPSSGLSSPTLTGWDQKIHTSYTMDQNLEVQYAFSRGMTATLGYVGTEARHLAVVVWPDGSTALLPPGLSTIPYQPYPAFNGNIHSLSYAAIANYNSMQAKLERRFTNGLSFLASYTYSHNLDDSREPLPDNNDGGDRMYNIIGLRPDYSNSPFNVPQRFTFTGTYDLPFGVGKKYLNHKGTTDILLGGWESTLLFRTQQGYPFTVGSNTATANGATAFPYRIGNPFKGGGTPPASNPTITCPATAKNRLVWFNPCAFADPPAATSITAPITGAANVAPYLGSPRSQISGPGYERIDMTLTKNFKTYESQYLQFRADVFNLFNTPSWSVPSQTSTGTPVPDGQITGNAFLGNYTPDPRFFQLALKYYF